jgi:hypothetical protein
LPEVFIGFVGLKKMFFQDKFGIVEVDFFMCHGVLHPLIQAGEERIQEIE